MTEAKEGRQSPSIHQILMEERDLEYLESIGASWLGMVGSEADPPSQLTQEELHEMFKKNELVDNQRGIEAIIIQPLLEQRAKKQSEAEE